jgi:addiction module RelE/StbE family toxin
VARRASLSWTAPALDDLDDIASFIAMESPRAAAALVRKALAAIERLRDNPDSGRWVPEIEGKTHREVIVPPIRIIYRVEGGRVLLIHVVRSERLLRLHRLR